MHKTCLWLTLALGFGLGSCEGTEPPVSPASGGTPVASGGGPQASGGLVGTGGTTISPTGGAATGGSSGSSTGGKSSGGSATGGAPTGGKASGGTSTGGNATGGKASGSTCIVSSPSGYWQTATATAVTSGTADVTVNDTSTAQTWEGFGGCFNELGWTYLQQLSAADRDRALQLLFGADGANFALGRIPIGASDYATNRYTLDETANDTSMANFSISRDQQSLIPYIKAAMAIKSGIRFWASPWTPPTWMKTGPFQSGGTPSNFDGGNMTDSDSILKAHAQYFVKFVQAYGQQGITVETIAPQNEPGYSQNYPSCLWTSALFTKFVGQYLGPAISAAGLSTKIMLGTMSNNSSGKDGTILSAVMGDATAKGYIKVMGLQWGMLDNAASYKSYNVPMWATEHKCGNYPWNPSGSPAYVEPAPNNQAYGVESWGYIKTAINNGVTAYNAWNMVLDTMGKGIDTARQWAQDSLLVVNTSSKTLTLTPAYYVFRHFSQFAVPGAKVVGTSGGDAVAFKNPDGSIVAVMYNSGGAKTSIVSIGGTRLQFSMPGTGWATIKYSP